MTAAEAIVAIVDAEAVIVIQPDGSISLDGPSKSDPAEARRVIEALNTLQTHAVIAREFESGAVFPSAERLIAIAREAAPAALTALYVESRFAHWIIDRALRSGRLKRCGDGGYIAVEQEAAVG